MLLKKITIYAVIFIGYSCINASQAGAAIPSITIKNDLHIPLRVGVYFVNPSKLSMIDTLVPGEAKMYSHNNSINQNSFNLATISAQPLNQAMSNLAPASKMIHKHDNNKEFTIIFSAQENKLKIVSF